MERLSNVNDGLNAKLSSITDDHYFDLADCFSVLLRHWVIFAATVATITGLAALAAFTLPPSYQATAEIMIDPYPIRSIDAVGAVETLPQSAELVESQVNFIRSQRLLERVVLELDLISDPDFDLIDGTPGRRSAISRALGRLSQIAGSSIDGSVEAAFDSENDAGDSSSPVSLLDAYPDEQLRAWAVDLLEKGLETERLGDSYILQLSYSSSSPKLAAKIPKHLAHVYLSNKREERQASRANAIEWLKKRVIELKQKLLDSEADLETYRREHDLISTSADFALSPVGLLTGKLLEAEAKVAEMETRLQQIEAVESSGGNLLSVSDLMNTPEIVLLLQQRGDLERKRVQLAKDYGANHPNMLQAAADQEVLSAKIGEAIDNVIGGLRNEIEIAKQRRSQLKVEYDAAKLQQAKQNSDNIRARMLQNEAESVRSMYAAALNRLRQLEERQNALDGDSGMRLVTVPKVPEHPNFPRPPLMIMGGFTCSVILGAFFALLRSRWDATLRTSDEAEKQLGVPCWACLPTMNKLTKGGESTYQHLLQNIRSGYFEHMRSLYFNNIKPSADDSNFQIIMVTSSVPNEGKSTLAMSMALTAASSSARTLLLDLDLRNPSVIGLLGASSDDSGPDIEQLCGTITHREDLKEISIIGLKQTNLHFGLPHRRDDNSLAFLSSDRIVEMLDEDFHAAYDIVVIDTPPVIGFADVGMIAPFADVVLYAVRWGVTDRELARHGLKTVLERSKHKVNVGSIVTRANPGKQHFYSKIDSVAYSKQYRKYYAST